LKFRTNRTTGGKFQTDIPKKMQRLTPTNITCPKCAGKLAEISFGALRDVLMFFETHYQCMQCGTKYESTSGDMTPVLGLALREERQKSPTRE